MNWKPLLYQYSLRIAGNRWDAEDLAQEAWLKLDGAVRNHPDRPVSRAFLYRIARNAWIDIQRKQKIRTTPIEQLPPEGAADPSLSSRELLEQLAERLPPKMAVILLLMDVFDFTAKETAEYVRMKDPAVQVALGRARAKLANMSRESSADKPSQAAGSGAALPADFDALVDAFRRRDPEGIYRAYIGLAQENIHLAGLRAVGTQLYFTFRDPDGNMFRVVSK